MVLNLTLATPAIPKDAAYLQRRTATPLRLNTSLEGLRPLHAPSLAASTARFRLR